MKKFALCISLLFISNYVIADNGQVTFAYPVDNISIDGNLSDWPDHLKPIPIKYEFNGEEYIGNDDFNASFRVGYNLSEQALYVAISITDDVYQVDTQEGSAWNESDSIIAYIDTDHSTRGSAPELYTVIGPQRPLFGVDSSWAPTTKQANWSKVDVAIQQTGNTIFYEWHFKLEDSTSDNQTIGFDLVLCDRDTDDESSCFAWGPNNGKSQAAGRLGDIVLLQANQSLSDVQGQIKPHSSVEGSEEISISKARITSMAKPNLWVQVKLDEDGKFSTKLPIGTYQITTPTQWLGTPWGDIKMKNPEQKVTVEVIANRLNEAPPLLLTTLDPPNALEPEGVLFNYSTDQNQRLEQVIKEYMDFYRVPGASIALVKDGKLAYHKTFGTQNYYTNQPVENNTLFEAASITKIVFAFAVNRLAERGVIDLDKPLYQYLPFEEIAYDERYKKITARHVLSHQTGFPNWRWMNDDGQIDLKFYPGIKFGYSGEGFEYLARVIAHITNKPLEQIMLEEVQQPMGFVENTYFSDSEPLREVASHGHFGHLTTALNIPSEFGVAHSMFTEAKTFSHFMLSLMAKKGLSADSYTKMLEPQVEAPLDDDDRLRWPNRYGLGFNLMNSPYGRVYGHGGNNGDFTCIFEIYEDHDMGFIIFTNSETGTTFFQALREYLIIGQPSETP